MRAEKDPEKVLVLKKLSVAFLCSSLCVLVCFAYALNELPRHISANQDLTEELDERIFGDVAKKWTIGRLTESADAVIIGEFEKKLDVKLPESDKSGKSLGSGVVAIESRFTVVAVLKQDMRWKKPPQTVRVLHFLNAVEVVGSNAPHLIDFSTVILRQPTIDILLPEATIRSSFGEPAKPDKATQYLLFLSTRQNGRYQPVSGQYFPELSFRRLGEFRD